MAGPEQVDTPLAARWEAEAVQRLSTAFWWKSAARWNHMQALKMATALVNRQVTVRPVAPTTRQPARIGSCGGWDGAVASLWGPNAPTACRVLWCESKGSPSARNASGASGLMQLMPVHAGRFVARGWSYYPDVFDGWKNLTVAHDLWLSSGWGPWSCA